MTKRVKKICSALFKRYPSPVISLNYSNPVELLVATILSAQCTDRRVNAVTSRLFIKYNTAKDYSAADPQLLEQEIRSCGFFRTKTRSIIGCCKEIVNRFDGNVPPSIDDLVKLPGVGKKTANVILGVAFGIPAIAIDTHMIRVSGRLGLSDSANPDKVEKDLMSIIPREEWNRFNMALILFGRETCRAKSPLCSKCDLSCECRWPGKEI